jgi:glycosyltransferase involved in cell wall biosynthesis
LKIIQVQTQAEAAGAQRVSDMVGEGLRQLGHDVRTVFMYRKTEVYDADPYADFILKARPSGSVDQIRASIGLVSHLRQQKPDAVISYQYYGNIFGTIGGRLAGAKYLVANQSGAPQSSGMLGIASKVDKLMGMLGLFDYSIVNSAWTEEQFKNYPLSYRRRIRRIDHGVLGPDRSYDKSTARARFGLPQDVLLAVSTGRQTVHKNQKAIIGALIDLPHMHAAVAGVGPDRDALVEFAERSGVSDRMHFVGEVPPSRIFEFIAAGDVFAFPSSFETFGLSVAEAAISGIPVVSSNLEVLKEVLADADGEPAALFTATNDAAGVAKAISQVLADAQLRERLIAAGRRLSSRYLPQQMCIAYAKLLA